MRARVLTDAAARATSVPLQKVVPLKWPLGLALCTGLVCLVAALFTSSGRGASGFLHTSLVHVPRSEENSRRPRRFGSWSPSRRHRTPVSRRSSTGSSPHRSARGQHAPPCGLWAGARLARSLRRRCSAGEWVSGAVDCRDGSRGERLFGDEPVGSLEGAAGARVRRFIPVTMIPDHAPTVRVEDPGHDLVVADANRTIAIRAAASDDIGLRSLEIRYTKVSGSGEQFTSRRARFR